MNFGGYNDEVSITNGLPLGLAFGMAMKEQALDNYSRLTEYEKEKLIAESKGVKSKAEMQQLIERIEEGMY